MRWVTTWLSLVAAFVASASLAAPTLDLQLVAANLDEVTSIVHAGDGSGRLFITLQGGRVVVYDGTNVLATPFLDIRPLVLNDSAERGLLSVVFHPGYATNGFFYVYYTALDTSNMVARFMASPPGANSVNTNTMMTVIRLPHPGQLNHNGGDLQFGPDGYLYLGPGDGGSGCDPPNNAQNLGSPLGKLLRIDVSNFSTNYTIPPTNPFVGTNGARPEIWAYGLRNPWRFSFDRASGDLWIGDVGQNLREEVDLQPAGSAGGQNYGWRLYEGFLTNTCSVTFSNVPTVLPILDYDHGSNRCAIMGGYRYRGTKIPPLYGTYLFADECGGQIYGAVTNASGGWTSMLLTATVFTITTFGEDQAGELYVPQYAIGGAIYRIVWKDSDGDGMPDDWESQYGLNPTNAADATLDPDGDGFSNLQEFQAGTDPTNAASALRIASVAALGTNVVVSFTSVAGKLYRFESAENLVTNVWTTVTNNVHGTGAIVPVTDLGAASLTNRFYRVRLVP